MQSEISRVTVYRRDGSVHVRPTDTPGVSGPVARWKYPLAVAVVGELSDEEKVALGRLIADEQVWAEADDFVQDEVIVMPCTDAALRILESTAEVKRAVEIGPSGWRVVGSDETHGIESDWSALTASARSAANSVGLSDWNLYLLDDDLERVTDLQARRALVAFKQDWVARITSPSLVRELTQAAYAADWNSPAAVAARETAAQRIAEANREAAVNKAARAAKAAATRARNKNGREELKREGWPNEWSPANVSQWRELGGGVSDAQAWAVRGWSSAEVRRAASIHGVSGLPRRTLTAAVCRELGDTLADYVSGNWQTPTEETTASIKAISTDGTRRRVFFSPNPRGILATEWRRGVNDADWRLATTWEAEDMASLSTESPSALRLDTTELSAIAGFDAVALGCLNVTGNGADEDNHDWTDETAQTWAEDLEYYAVYADGIGARPLPALVIGGILVEVNVRGKQHLVAIGEDGPIGTEVASFLWFSESGGAPISWNGCSYLTQVAPHLAISHTTGDVERDTEFYSLDDQVLAEATARWLVEVDAVVPTAMKLEPFDPDGELTSERRAQFADAIEAVFAQGIAVRFAAPTEDVRAQLGRISTRYERVAAAFANPSSKRSVDILEAILDSAETGVLGGLLYG